VKTVIFVGGTARCGSTLIDLILGNDPRGFSLGEVYAVFHPWRTHHFDVKCACGVYPCRIWEEVRTLHERDLYARLFERLDLDFIVDSSKRLTWIIDQNMRLRRAADTRCHNVFFYKDPTLSYHSWWKRGLRDIGEVADKYRYYTNAMRAGLPMVTVNFDWFVAEGEAALKLLCNRLNIPWFEGKMRFWQKEHHHAFGSFGPRRQLFDKEHACIYQEAFHAEFESRKMEFERTLAHNRPLSAILEQLRKRDIRNVDGYPDPRRCRIRKPLFYYRDRLAALKYRLRPERYLDREASLIREWRV
jgi:hypothetical protein